MEITIITPTYNRGEKLKKLYKSLVGQSSKDFKWLIIDDGSVDNTQNIVNELIKEEKIQIQYIKKENGGKHTALNVGIDKIDTILTFIVDSDDWLEENAIQIIEKYHSKYKDYKNISGYSFLRKYPDGKINNKEYPINELLGNYIDIRINGNIAGDKAEVFFTKCLKEFKFPEFESEKFLGEDIVWIDMALKYEMIHINEAIYISEYLDDGLTKNRRKNNIESPKGCVERAKRLMYRQCNMKTRLKGMLSYIIYSKFDNRSLKTIIQGNKWSVLFYIPSMCIYYKWKKEYLNK